MTYPKVVLAVLGLGLAAGASRAHPSAPGHAASAPTNPANSTFSQ